MDKVEILNRELLTKPGDTILETLEFLRMSQAELAERIGKTPGKVNDLITGKAPITVNTAIQLENVLGIDTQFWLNREALYREKLARIEEQEHLLKSVDWLKNQPVKELKKKNYLSDDMLGPNLVKECLGFYGVATPIQWQNVYVNNYIQYHLQSSEAQLAMLSSMAAWLRIGEIKLRKLKLPEYNRAKFKEILKEVKDLNDHPTKDFSEKVQHLCQAAGVAVIYSNNFSNASIRSASRWIGGVPLIQFSDNNGSINQFLYTFFHAAGHILLHGKKNVFIEDFELIKNDVHKEKEADEFAQDYLRSRLC